MPDEDSVITKPTQLASTEPTDAEVEALDDGDDEDGDEDQGGSEPDEDE